MLEAQPQLSFVDATLEQMPRLVGAPSERDVLFIARAQIVVVFWDGRSAGTKRLIDWLEAQGKDHVVGYVARESG
jgi:hypothetical protein